MFHVKHSRIGGETNIMQYTADFETITDPEDCRVWASGICSIDEKLDFKYGNDIDFFFDFAKYHPASTFYFHNLKFDGEFILNWLFRNDFNHSLERKLYKNEFSTLISDKGQWYSIKICFNDNEFVTIYDSLKIIPFGVEAVAKAFDLPIKKGTIDYNKYREIGHILTEKETDYLRNDVEIMARALCLMFKQGLCEMTQGSNALKDYKRIIGSKNFKRWFPVPGYDYDVRQSYKGGFTYCDSRTQGRDIEEGIVLDVNSLYPSVMYYEKLPYGEGKFFDGKYIPDKLYDLYVQMFTCSFNIKDKHIPTLQLKNNLSFVPTDYLETSNGEEVTLCMTNVDYELFRKHYHVHNIQFHSGWKFKSTTELFKEYIDKWNKVKMESTLNGNVGMRTLAKLMLNALYGKFALNPNVCSKIPYFDEDMVKYRKGEAETRDPIYIPVGTFITAYARRKTISSAQKVYDRFLYADTDSLHLIGTDLPKDLEIDPVKLGAWKHESTFTRARFIRQKTYVEEIDGKLEVTCAGMPSRCYEHVTWDNFKVNSQFAGKLQFTHVPGGIVLKDIDFTIKE